MENSHAEMDKALWFFNSININMLCLSQDHRGAVGDAGRLCQKKSSRPGRFPESDKNSGKNSGTGPFHRTEQHPFPFRRAANHP